MNIFKKVFQSEHYEISWKRILLLGSIIMILGILLAISSFFKTNTIIMSAREFSWLPVSGMIIFILGLLECIEAYFAKASREFLQNLQVGILDTVVGGLIVFSVSEVPQRLSMMIATFLIVRGLVRIALVHTLNLPYMVSTTLFGVISILLGFLICIEWPTNEGWFLSLSLNIEIAFRGWAMIMFAIWLKIKKKQQIAHTQ
jgi:uncharacterized membrane protein HdeD (DUF308 family)